MYPMMCNQILLKIFILLLNIGYCWNGPKSHLRNLVSREIWALRNLVPSWTSFYGILILGPNFMGLEFLGTHISSRPNFLGTLFLKIQKSRAPVEIRKYFSTSLDIERFYISETLSFGRKMSRRKPVLLLGFSSSVADYEETKGFWLNFFYIKIIIEAKATFWTILEACRHFFNDLWPYAVGNVYHFWVCFCFTCSSRY